MSKWINVDAFVADARMVGLDTAEKVFFALAHQPGIDIVRCGECKKRKKNKFCLEYMRYEKNDEGFCSYGEREGEQ